MPQIPATAEAVAAIVSTPDVGTIVGVTEAAVTLLGRPSGQLIGRRIDDVFGPAPHFLGDTELHVRAVEQPDGSTTWCRLDPLTPGRSGAPTGHNEVVHVVDVTVETEAALALDRDGQRLRMLTHSSPDLVLEVSSHGYVVSVNPAAARELGHSAEQLTGVHLSDLLSRTQYDRVRHALDDALELGLPVDLSREWLMTTDGTPGWYLMRFIPDGVGDVRQGREEHAQRSHVFLVCTNVNELVNYERRLANLALIDPLTSATNRAATFDRLQHAIDRLDRRPDQGLAIAAIGIDHFASINDALGHHTGDSALALVAEELRRTVRGQDTVGRLGGDEFIVLLEDVPSRHEAAVLGSRLEAAMRTIHFDGVRAQSVRITASVGIAWTDRRVTTDEFVARSRRALAEAKRRGRARAWLEQSSDGEASPRGGPTMAELNAALRREEFELVYQPIVSALDGRPRAVEALLRWRHPEHGLLAPNRFLGWLLENGQIGPVGQWVVRTSISQLGHWKRSHPALADLALHVNLTAAELALPELPALLRNEIELAEIDPAAVCIEVTEQALSGVMVAPSTLTQVADVGVRIVLDDFGTGISSLSHLRTKPLHGIKVDRSFVVGAENDPDERSIVEGVVAIAAGLGIETTAEGVETREQAQWLTDLGCTFLQGYHFARPSAADAVPALVGN